MDKTSRKLIIAALAVAWHDNYDRGYDAGHDDRRRRR
jgi:hypothetical protein